jgi:hypothetical protein
MAETLLRSWDAWDVDFRIGYGVDRTTIVRGMDEQAFEELADRLEAQPGTPIGDRGDKYVVDGNQLLVKIAGDDTTAAVRHVVVGYAPPPEMLIPLIHGFARSFGTLWKKIAARETVPA